MLGDRRPTGAGINRMSASLGVAQALWQRRGNDPFEQILAVLGFTIFMGTFRDVLLTESANRTAGSALFQLVAGSIYLTGIVVLLARGIPRPMFRVLLHAWPLVLLTILPLISTLWSQDPEATLRRSITLLLSSAFTVFLVVRFDLKTTFKLVAISFAIFLIIGVIAGAVPGLGITPSGHYAGAWRGLSGQKNVFGRTVALAVALMPMAAATGLITQRKLAILFSFLAFGLLILSRSATSLVCAVTSVPLGVFVYVCLGGRIGRLRLRPELGIAVLVLAVVIGAAAITYGSAIVLEALGRDPTLTGRTDIWKWAISTNADRQWLGSGFRAFWIDANTLYYSEFFWMDTPDEGRSDTWRGPDHAHSGYVDQYLEFGWLGIGVLAATVLSALFRLKQVAARDDYQLGLAFASVMSFLLVYSTSERTFLQHSEDLWFLFCLFYLYAVKRSLQPIVTVRNDRVASPFAALPAR